MKFLMMHKHDESIEESKMPPQEFIEAMGKMVGDLLQSGVMKDGAGLGKTANRTRVTTSGGKPTVQHGPYTPNANEFVATVLKVKAQTREEAVAWAQKVAVALGDAEIEVGKTTEAWDLGYEPIPANPPWNALFLIKATKDSEAGKPLSAAAKKAFNDVKAAMKKEGVLEADVPLAPGSKSTRINMSKGTKTKIVDGPFAESKELVGGFALVELPSKEAALELANRYGNLMLTAGDKLEMDLRPVDE